MKARTITVPKVAVGVNLSDEKNAVMQMIAKSVSFEYRTAPSDCGSDTVGCLCGLKGYVKSDERSSLSEELLIFSGLDGKELNKVLELMRNNGASVPLKAMLTANNKDWTISALAQELAREHEYMNNRKQGETDGQKEV